MFFIDSSLESDVAAACRIFDADAGPGPAGDGKTVILQGGYNIVPVVDEALADHAGQDVGDCLGGLLLVPGQIGREGTCFGVTRIVRIVQIQCRIDPGFPGIDTGPVGAVIIGLEPLAGGQLDVGHDEVQFKAVLVPVLDPGNAVLVLVKARQQRPLKAVHDLLFLICRQIGLVERQDAGRVFLGIRAGVDQLDHLVWIAAQQIGQIARAVLAQEVIDRATAAALTAGEEFNDHGRRQFSIGQAPARWRPGV